MRPPQGPEARARGPAAGALARKTLAEQFLNFILEPKNGARISSFTQFSTPNRAAKTMLTPAEQNHPAVYPPPEVEARLEFLKDLGGRLRLYDEVWTQVKAK